MSCTSLSSLLVCVISLLCFVLFSFLNISWSLRSSSHVMNHADVLDHFGSAQIRSDAPGVAQWFGHLDVLRPHPGNSGEGAGSFHSLVFC